MDLPPALLPPAWVTKPEGLASALKHNAFYCSEFDEAVTVDDTEKFAGGIRQFMFWKRQLAPSVTPLTVIFALLGPTGLATLNVINVMTGALRAFCLQNATEFSQGANTQFLAISFKSSEHATAFRSKFKYYGDSVVAYVQPEARQSRRYSLLWLPPLFAIEKVRSFLNKYSDKYTTVKGSMHIGGNQYMPSSMLRGTIELKDGMDFNDLPHLIPLPAPHLGHALLIIDGRENFCLKCLSRGHLRRDCDRPRCPLCRFHHLPSDVCERSTYAKKVARSSGVDSDYCWTDDVSDVSANEHLPPVVEAAPGVASPPLQQPTAMTVVPSDMPPPVVPDSDHCSSLDDLSSVSIVLPSIAETHSGCDLVSSPECIHDDSLDSNISSSISSIDMNVIPPSISTQDSVNIPQVVDQSSATLDTVSDMSDASCGESDRDEQVLDSSGASCPAVASSSSPSNGIKRPKLEVLDPMDANGAQSPVLSDLSYELRSKVSKDKSAAALGSGWPDPNKASSTKHVGKKKKKKLNLNFS